MTVAIYKHEKSKSTDVPRLGVLVKFLPLNDPEEKNIHTEFYSMGPQMDKAYVPSPNGKGIMPRVGAPTASGSNLSNWYLFVETLVQLGGLPPGKGLNDLSVFEGLWVYMTQIDEPEGRSQLQSRTAEVQQEQRAKRKIAVCSEVIMSGSGWPEKPFNYGGPATQPIAQAPTQQQFAAPQMQAPQYQPPQQPQYAPPVQPQYAAPQAPAPSPAPPQAQLIQAGGSVAQNAEMQTFAGNALGSAIASSPNGIKRLAARMAAHAELVGKVGEQSAAYILATFIDNPTNLNILVGSMGYTVVGDDIVPIKA
jgi:hypothetical protein